jgi:hypothetical protein
MQWILFWYFYKTCRNNIFIKKNAKLTFCLAFLHEKQVKKKLKYHYFIIIIIFNYPLIVEVALTFSCIENISLLLIYIYIYKSIGPWWPTQTRGKINPENDCFYEIEKRKDAYIILIVYKKIRLQPIILCWL